MTLYINNVQTMQVFLKRSLNNILKLCGRKQNELRAACNSALETLTKEGRQSIENNPAQFFTPFKIACETTQPKIIEAAIDCIQKLIVYGYVTDKVMYNENHSLTEIVIQTVCKCYEQPENVQLQVIKALSTAVTTDTCNVQGAILRLAVQTCFRIQLLSRNHPVNRGTAKGTLTQMLDLVFRRMETAAENEDDESSFRPQSVKDKSSAREHVSVFVNNVLADIVSRSEEEEAQKEEQRKEQNQNQSNETEATQSKQEKSSSKNDGESSNQNKQNGDVEQTPNSLIKDGEYHANGNDATEDAKGFSNAYEVDAYVVFRALISISMRKIQGGSVQYDVDSRVLALEMILFILENCSHIFRNSEPFISAIKEELTLSLLKNCLSLMPQIFRLSLLIFLNLISNFKDHLKTEIGGFFTDVFLKILQSSNSSFDHKKLVIEAMKKVCQDSQILVELFVNYDCDLESLNIYESMVSELSRIAQRTNKETSSPEETFLKYYALECLVTILRSLVEWTERFDFGNDDSGSIASEDSNSTTEPSTPYAPGPEEIEKKKQMKEKVEKGIALFNKKPQSGIEYLIQSGHIQRTPEDVAQFFHASEGLDKVLVGEYLGEHEQFNIEVLHAFIDMIDFTGMDILRAMRHLVSHFKPAGEAQKIDRVVEKFAERLCRCNPDQFASAETAYTLSYSIMMLNTDLHHPMVKNRMTLSEFISNNRGIDDGKNLDPDLLSYIYDSIQREELKLEDQSNVDVENIPFLNSFKRKQILYTRETEKIVTKLSQLFSRKRGTKTTYFYVSHSEHVKPMFEVTWAPMLAAFSVILEDFNEEKFVKLCMEGFDHGIHISCCFNMETERNAFVSSLTKFTYLSNLREMQPKNVKSIKLLLNIAKREGNYLESSWYEVLSSISQLERLQLIATGIRPNHITSSQPSTPRSSRSSRNQTPRSARRSSQQHSRGSLRSSIDQKELGFQFTETEVLNSQSISSAIDGMAIDRLFSHSFQLDNDAVVEFVEALCRVSNEEVSIPTEPRMFSLQKIVEVADLNMARIRFVWSNIWSHISNHMIQVGLHSNQAIAEYAVDSLRQLAMKFLEKEELQNFQFQREFLKPFDVIMSKTSETSIREMILRCLSNMILARGNNIKSGWKSIFICLELASNDSNEQICALAYDSVNKLTTDLFPLISENFVDCVNCLKGFACNPINSDRSLSSIDHFESCAEKIVSGKVAGVQRTESENSEQGVYTEEHNGVWFPILTALHSLVSDKRLEIRVRSLSALFKILNKHGVYFTEKLWTLVFTGVLFPIFDDVSHVSEENRESEWLRTTCHKALSMLIELFVMFYATVQPLFERVLDLVCYFISPKREHLAIIGITCLSQLVKGINSVMPPQEWELVCHKVQSSVQHLNPALLLAEKDQRTLDLPDIIAMHKSSLLFIQTLDEIISCSYHHLEPKFGMELISAFQSMFDPCFTFNQDNKKRIFFVEGGHTEVIENILTLEARSLRLYFKHLHHMFIEGAPSWVEASEEVLHRATKRIVDRYLELTGCNQTMADEQGFETSPTFVPQSISSKWHESRNLVPVIVQILNGLLDYPEEKFQQYIKDLYPRFTDLLLSSNTDVRYAVRKTLLRAGRISSIVQ
eukprot:gb/GECH01013893.1/.p1 GENE.gb/GECH01013893.1/~~gb/GECH01013893.1/.p1  ORF type:complete len:1618 (+),score=375.39 gb/GECH01013893.1/:1-4854(+)